MPSAEPKEGHSLSPSLHVCVCECACVCVCACVRVCACVCVSLSALDVNEISSIKFPAIHYFHIKVDGFLRQRENVFNFHFR